MMKEVIVLDGVIINVGPWDYRIINMLVGVDENENPLYEERAQNPLPEGAASEERDMEFDPDRGWYEVGTEPLLNFEDDARRTFTDIFTLMVQKSVITLNEVPAYNEYDYKAAVQSKLSDPHA